MSASRTDPQKVVSCCLHSSFRVSARASEKVERSFSYHVACHTAFGIRACFWWAKKVTTLKRAKSAGAAPDSRLQPVSLGLKAQALANLLKATARLFGNGRCG